MLVEGTKCHELDNFIEVFLGKWVSFEKEYNSVSEQADDIIETAEMLKKAAFLIEYNEFY